MPVRKLRSALKKRLVAAVLNEVTGSKQLRTTRITGARGKARKTEDGHIERHAAHPALPPFPQTVGGLTAQVTRTLQLFQRNPIRYIEDRLKDVVDAQLTIAKDTAHPRAVAAGTNLMHYALGRPVSRVQRDDKITIVIKRPGRAEAVPEKDKVINGTVVKR